MIMMNLFCQLESDDMNSYDLNTKPDSEPEKSSDSGRSMLMVVSPSPKYTSPT
jgi:hypothetical protein